MEGLQAERGREGKSVDNIFCHERSDEEESSTTRIAHQVVEEVLRTRRSVTPGVSDLEEEFSHKGGNNGAGPPSHSAAATGIVTRPMLQAARGQG